MAKESIFPRAYSGGVAGDSSLCETRNFECLIRSLATPFHALLSHEMSQQKAQKIVRSSLDEHSLHAFGTIERKEESGIDRVNQLASARNHDCVAAFQSELRGHTS